MSTPELAAALSAWQAVLGAAGVITDSRLAQLTNDCSAQNRKVMAILYPSTRDAVIQILRIAVQYRICLYPYSTGHNWGYGSANPVQDNCVLVELSRMDEIISFDSDAGLLTIQPGVTQRILNTYLKARNLAFLIPVTGAGPDCSLVGNALERGYGITPYSDHFGAVMAMEVVLANGEVCRSMLDGMGGGGVDKAFKWGLGPYVDGIFSQSNFGIVTEMTIALSPMPERIEAFFFRVKKAEDLELVVTKVRQLIREVGTVTGSINLMNKYRVLSMSEAYPKTQLGVDGLIPEQLLQQMMARNQVMEWTGVGAIYGNKKVVAAVRGEIRRILHPVANRLIFVTPERVNLMHAIVQSLDFMQNFRSAKIIKTLHKFMQIFAGEPSEIALPLAYWRSGLIPVDGKPMNPDQDGCGLIWYAPLVPMQPDLVRQFVTMAESICKKHGIEPLITFTTLSGRCLDSTIPILFDRANPVEVIRAQACYAELFETGLKSGFVPYRLGVQSMSQPNEKNAMPVFLQAIKDALDPNHIIAPGRYGL